MPGAMIADSSTASAFFISAAVRSSSRLASAFSRSFSKSAMRSRKRVTSRFGIAIGGVAPCCAGSAAPSRWMSTARSSVFSIAGVAISVAFISRSDDGIPRPSASLRSAWSTARSPSWRITQCSGRSARAIHSGRPASGSPTPAAGREAVRDGDADRRSDASITEPNGMKREPCTAFSSLDESVSLAESEAGGRPTPGFAHRDAQSSAGGWAAAAAINPAAAGGGGGVATQ